MAKRKRTRKAKTKWHLSGKKVSLAKQRNHKPLALLKLYHTKMQRNIGRLENIIDKREAAGE